MLKRSYLFAVTLVSASLLQACVTYDPYSGEKKTSNATKGAVAGAVAGAVLGNQVKGNKKTRQNARVAGALLGGLIGGGVGNQMDKQEAQLRHDLANTGVGVTRQGDQIILNMPGNITFETGRASIKGNFHQVLDAVAKVLTEYKDTSVQVAGHTDSVGSARDNQVLSEQRARSVANYLQTRGVSASRMSTSGFGESQPVASNTSEAGRSQNRRVEITLAPRG